MRREVVVGTRASRLALAQADWVVDRLRARYPRVSFVRKEIRTTGDNILETALAKIGDKGLFTKELEQALLDREIDLAVHSMKDLPTRLPEGLAIGAVSIREYPGDVFISRGGERLEELPGGAVLGTSSLRRTAQLLAYRPDLRVVPVRGNVQTRLRKLDEGVVDALVLAWAGMFRLGLTERVTHKIPVAVCLPAVGQGALGIEARADDTEVLEMLRMVDHAPTRAAVQAERTLLRRLEGGCQVPVGALGRLRDGRLVLEAVVASLDGTELVRSQESGPADRPEALGDSLAARLLEMGAAGILARVRAEA
ncbi:MAG: hydroxymethylbilane synthase [Bacillota bacterium]|jgi:hydroxymethylbilane synthase